MNLHDFILEHGLADTDPGQISAAYITAVLALPGPGEQLAALEPSVRPHASRLASTIRRALRSMPAHTRHGSQGPDGGPAHDLHGSQRRNGGPAQESSDSQTTNGGPALPAWAQQNATLIAYCRDHQGDHYWIPGSGRRKLAEITAGEWLARARWLTQQSEGTAKSAQRTRDFALLIEAAGLLTLGDVLAAVTP